MGRRGRVGMSPKGRARRGERRTRRRRRRLDAICLRQDDRAAGATTIARKRSVFANVLRYAVEPEELPGNPLDVRRDERPGVTLPEVHVAESRGMARPVLVSIEAERFILRQEFALLSRTQLVAHLPPGDRVVSEQPWRVARNSSAGAAERGQRPPNR